MNRTRLLPSLPLVLLFGAVIAWQAMAQSRPSGPAAQVVALIRMETLFENLNERADAKAEVDRMERDIAEEQKTRQDEITKLEDELKQMMASAARDDLRDKIALKHFQLQAWTQGANEELEAEKAMRLQDLYRKIKTAIKALAEAAAYDVVVQNDESSELPFDTNARVPAQVQVLQQISNRKVLYVKPALDVTQDLIVRMNNEHRAAINPPGANPPARKKP
jgi:Skp family chaperone for outer membrane proteins